MTKTETPAALLESARTTLVHARMFFDQGRTNDAARLAYIAAMQAAHAYILTRLIEPAQLPKPLAYELKNLARLKADYDREPAPHDSFDLARITWWIDRAGRLVEEIGTREEGRASFSSPLEGEEAKSWTCAFASP